MKKPLDSPAIRPNLPRRHIDAKQMLAFTDIFQQALSFSPVVLQNLRPVANTINKLLAKGEHLLTIPQTSW